MALDTFAARTDDWSSENYARTLTGWANTIATNGGPVDVFLDVGRTNGSTLAYDAVAYAPGAVFEDAVSARAFLTATLAVEITNADDPAADGLYAYQPAQLSYTAPSGWTLLRVGLDWVLLDATGAQQATALETAANPARVASWDGMLATATLRLAGAGWTITGDAPA